jgi:hypothetical protein
MFLIFWLISVFAERLYSEEVFCTQVHSDESSMSLDQILKQVAYYGIYTGAGGVAGAVLGIFAATAFKFRNGPIVVSSAIFGVALGGFACLKTF